MKLIFRQSLCELQHHSLLASHHKTTNPLLQVKNLEERIKVDQMKEALTEIFSEYGTVIDLVAKRNLKAKGQAFVVFDDTEAAERAIKEVQGFELFEKPMVLDYARTRSDATVEQEGNTEDLESHKRRRLAEKGTLWITCELGFIGTWADLCCLMPRAQTSSRSRRDPEEAQTSRRSCGARSRCCTTHQSSTRRWAQVVKPCSRRCCARGIFTSKQDSIRAEPTRQLRCGQPYIDIREVPGVQRGAPRTWKDGYSVRGVRRGQGGYRCEGEDGRNDAWGRG